jgi:hypothetical protein
MRHKFAHSLAMRISGLMEANKTKTTSRSQSKRPAKRKPAPSRAQGGTTATPAPAKAAVRARRTKTAAKRSPSTQAAGLSAQQRAQRIAVAAYYFAEQRGFAPNRELDDWLAAERSL